MVIGNLVRTYNIKETYIDNNDPCLGTLVAAAFAIASTKNRVKGHTLGQLVFVHNMILLIKNAADWELLRQ